MWRKNGIQEYAEHKATAAASVFRASVLGEPANLPMTAAAKWNAHKITIPLLLLQAANNTMRIWMRATTSAHAISSVR